MVFSHSRVESFESCPYKWKLHYLDELETLPNQDPNNALICGNTMHLGAEKGLEEALKFYKSNYYILNDYNVNEIIKFEYWIPKLENLLADLNVAAQEYYIETSDFKGYIDLITNNLDGTVDIFDFKYSNNQVRYKESSQLYVYKHYLEQQGFKVKRLGFIFIPKTFVRQKKTEDLYQFRQRLKETISKQDISIMEIKFNQDKVTEYFNTIKKIEKTTEFPKNPTKLCDWCDYKEFCQEGIDYMILPSSKRRDIKKPKKRKIWMYGPPFSGKTTMLDKAPNPLNLNTDGNIEFVTMPYIHLKDKIWYEGRLRKQQFAWELFKETLEELEKKENDFKTIIVDLLEDNYEMCRLYMYDKLGITHEADDSFKAWDKVRTEYLSTMRRFFNMDYENLIIISHEDKSKDLTKKNGDKITAIKPNLTDKVANKIAGMVGIVARVVVDGDERTLNFKSDEIIFGGGRLKGLEETKIPLNWEELARVYDNVEENKETKRRMK